MLQNKSLNKRLSFNVIALWESPEIYCSGFKDYHRDQLRP